MLKKFLFFILLYFGFCPKVLAVNYTSAYPPYQNSAYVKATSTFSSDYQPWFATDPGKSLTGAWENQNWISASVFTNQRFHLDLGAEKVIKRIYIENGHWSGGYTDRSVRHFTFWGSNSSSSFSDLTYSSDSGWTQIGSEQEVAQHTTVDEADPQYFYFTNSSSYRYYAIKFSDSWGTAYMVLRRIELQEIETEPTPTPTPLPESTTFQNAPKVYFSITSVEASPSAGYTTAVYHLHNQDPNVLILGYDLFQINPESSGFWVINGTLPPYNTYSWEQMVCPPDDTFCSLSSQYQNTEKLVYYFIDLNTGKGGASTLYSPYSYSDGSHVPGAPYIPVFSTCSDIELFGFTVPDYWCLFKNWVIEKISDFFNWWQELTAIDWSYSNAKYIEFSEGMTDKGVVGILYAIPTLNFDTWNIASESAVTEFPDFNFNLPMVTCHEGDCASSSALAINIPGHNFDPMLPVANTVKTILKFVIFFAVLEDFIYWMAYVFTRG